MYSRVSLQRSCWHVLSSVMESKAAPTQSSCPSGTDRFFLRHSRHFVPGYDRSVPTGRGSRPEKMSKLHTHGYAVDFLSSLPSSPFIFARVSRLLIPFQERNSRSKLRCRHSFAFLRVCPESLVYGQPRPY